MATKVAIVGGGIAGLYAAWRLRQLGEKYDVTVYEATPRLGGRIYTARFGISDKQSEPVPVMAELGAMRFPREHKLLFSLCSRLGLDDVDKTRMPDAWRGPFQLKSLYHLRGMTISADSFRSGEIPYRVRPHEKGKTPEALLEYAIFEMLERMIHDCTRTAAGRPDGGRRRVDDEKTDNEDEKVRFLKILRQRLQDREILSADEWMTFIKHDYTFAGIPLRNIGFWNVLKHFLSSEAFLLAHDGFGFLSVISNWNAPEAFKWLLTDFSPHQRFVTVPGGVGQIIDRLEREFDGELKREHAVTNIRLIGSTFKLTVSGVAGEAEADHVILAVPPRALSKIQLFDGMADKDWRKMINCSRPHRLAKIVLAYEEPWWQHTTIPGAESGRLFTDLPMRQIHYFGPRWLAENRWTEKRGEQYSLIMVYNDSHYEAFWRTFDVWDRVCRVPVDTDAEKDAETTLGVRLQAIGGSSLAFVSGDKMLPSPGARTGIDRLEVRHRMEEKVRQQLAEIHDYEVPVAVGGVYRDWSDEGGWHTWEPFVDVPKIKDVIVQPFCRDGDRIEVRKLNEGLGNTPARLYVCGEAYAWEQGWVEGALMTAERVVAAVAAGDYCHAPSWFKGTQDAYEKYLYPELPLGKQEELHEKYEEARREATSR